MVSAHDQFCLSHVCGEEYRSDPRYCPYADRMRKQRGYILPSKCEAFIQEVEHPAEKEIEIPGYQKITRVAKPKTKSKKIKDMVPDYLRL